jgi:hypothetical protein
MDELVGVVNVDGVGVTVEGCECERVCVNGG